MSVNFLGGLRKEIHHVKQMVDGSEKYEPAMVILSHSKKGRSFIIPIGAIWKYIDPSDNQDEVTTARDRQDFIALAKKIAWVREFSLPGSPTAHRAADDFACCVFAEAFSRGTGVLLCTSWNLAKMMQIFEITPSPQAAAQLLLWVQNELDDLKNYPEHDQDDAIPGSKMAEMILKCGTKTVFDGEIPMTEADLLVPDEVVRN